ncbi:MAG: tetratricopeptide repeat protein [Saprospirales bacterium]|nr:tetratricopeptide repeat protein [Saprospirales bacterium]
MFLLNLKYYIAGLCFLSIFSSLLLFCENDPGQHPSAPEGPDSIDSVATAGSPAFQLNQLGDAATQRGDYAAAIQYFQQSMDSAAIAADSFFYNRRYFDLACIYDRLSELPKAIDIAKPVLAAFIRSGDSARIGRAYSTLAAFYCRADLDAEGLDAARKGFDILKIHGALIERCAAYNQMAFTYSDRGHWNKALPLLDTALQLMRASGILDQLPSMYLNLGNGHKKLGHWSEARLYLESAANLADSLQQTHVQSVALLRLSQVAESTGDLSHALGRFKQSVTLRDSLFVKEKIQRLQDLEVRYQTKQKEQEIELLQANNRSEVLRTNLSLVLLGIAALSSLLLVFFWRSKLKRSRRLVAQHQQDMKLFIQTLLAKNTRLAELEEALQTMTRSAGQPAGAIAEHSDSTADELYNRRILTEADWVAFKGYFERVYPGYLHRLRLKFPDLSGAEERLFLLIKLAFNRQEIASTLGISADSVKKGRTRLRKRLNLHQETVLEQFIRAF